MIIGATRSGLVEAVFPVAVVAVDASGAVLAASGDVRDREFFMRSAIKAVQAEVSDRMGAALRLEQVALAAASHRGHPIHVAHVEQMLLEVGLEVGHLRCPPDRPGSPDADRAWAARGRSGPDRVFHNCSGKHAAMLRACVANDWPLDYTPPDHPLQRLVVTAAAEATGRAVTPVGIDGCGIPTLRSDVVGLARAFAAVATDDRFTRVRDAAMRFTALTGDGDHRESVIARAFPGVVKGGAMGCIGLGWPEGGLGFAAKCWTGDSTAAAVGLLDLMGTMGVLSGHARTLLAGVMAPPVLGGGHPVGRFEVLER